MLVVANTIRWWRGICAIALLLALLAPQPAMAIVPAWITGAICHAPSDDQPLHPAPVGATHVHCALCLMGQAVMLPPVFVPTPSLRLTEIDYLNQPSSSWAGPGPSRSYASRAPPLTV